MNISFHGIALTDARIHWLAGLNYQCSRLTLAPLAIANPVYKASPKTRRVQMNRHLVGFIVSTAFFIQAGSASVTTPDTIRTLQRKLYAKAKQETACVTHSKTECSSATSSVAPVKHGVGKCACLGVKNIGKPCALIAHARFDEGGQAKAIYGKAVEAPPDERGGNSLAKPKPDKPEPKRVSFPCDFSMARG
ncbi:hypothetical protein [Propionivibrio sp.]|uniref:hypothetical protein n=1 Tax=Propionivibrio sp. TaxID=2212460 RepID=UPI003BF1C209